MSRNFWILSIVLVLSGGAFFLFPSFFSSGVTYDANGQKVNVKNSDPKKVPTLEPLNKVLYDQKMQELANNPTPIVVVPKKDKNGNDIPPPPPKPNIWPVSAVYPNAGALLPFNRIIAYYGNLYSKKMGVLGEYAPEVMMAKLQEEVEKWELADPATPVIPALHYIAVVAQGSAGKDGMYRFRMPDSEIEKVLAMAEKINAIVFLDFQVAFSTLDKELPPFEKYLKMPNVHLGIDPEFSMKTGVRPGKVVGTFDAVDINFAANFLARIVKENNLTPKILVVHRYTEKMVTNYKNITPLPEVQIVMDMDGWGGAAKKLNTYKQFVATQPVHFTGFKLFYKNDIFDAGTTLMTPLDLLKLNPRPSYIQYQ
ncbi:MAG: hypothetical protein KBD55_03055 [Candidatus Pacebacteria bacterium]|jgi:hypothetical protein|nr:hypothetical protein [Candidatus Paceibacterota bacterium]